MSTNDKLRWAEKRRRTKACKSEDAATLLHKDGTADTPFASAKDAVKRMMSFHVYNFSKVCLFDHCYYYTLCVLKTRWHKAWCLSLYTLCAEDTMAQSLVSLIIHCVC